MARVLRLTRAGEWWSHKLSPLLATGYASAVFADTSTADTAGRLGLVLLALIPGAVYVSVLNDLTDLETDRVAGKLNRVADGSRRGGWLLLLATVSAGVGIAAVAWRDDPAALGLYAGAWIAFALYSVAPVRLKERGAAGALADGAGAHLFPHLLVAVVVLGGARPSGWALWLALVGAWAAALGVRGALLHQLSDTAADARAGVATFARSRPALARRAGKHVALPVELAAFAGLLVVAQAWAAAAFLAPYALFEWRRARRWGLAIVVVEPAKGFRILMHEYYVVFYPLALLLMLSIRDPGNLILLAAHCVLFLPAIWAVADDALEIWVRPRLGTAGLRTA